MLTGKQKSYLRSLSNKIKPIYQIGKEGVNDNLVNGVSDYLEAHELMKVSLLKSCPMETREAAIELSAKTGSEIVQLIGRTVILYRHSKDGDISLPR